MQRVLYIGNFMFPDKNAAANRVVSNGRIFRDLGYQVSFVGVRKNATSNIFETKEEYEDFEGYSLPVPEGIKDWLFYRKWFAMILPLLEQLRGELKIVVMYGCPTLVFFDGLLYKWCRKNKIMVFSDAVDWLSSNTGSLLYRIIKYLNTLYLQAYLYPKSDGVIAISTYLSAYYERKGCKVVRIPPLVADVPTDMHTKAEESCIPTVVYAGMPFALNGKKIKKGSYKDRLDLTVEYFAALKLEYRLMIYGITQEEYLRVIPQHRQLLQSNSDRIFFLGKAENILVKQSIAKADFTVFLRNANRTTTAGFPTKFAESIRLGTPVITTNTSDLAQYLEEGKNGFFVQLEQPESVVEALQKILLLPRETILNMKEHCRCNRSFCYEEYVKDLKKFIED